MSTVRLLLAIASFWTLTLAPLIADSAARAIRNLATQLEENFVYPDEGRGYASMLRNNLASGAYAQFESAQAFAQRVTNDLQATYPEGHLSLMPPGGAAHYLVGPLNRMVGVSIESMNFPEECV